MPTNVSVAVRATGADVRATLGFKRNYREKISPPVDETSVDPTSPKASSQTKDDGGSNGPWDEQARTAADLFLDDLRAGQPEPVWQGCSTEFKSLVGVENLRDNVKTHSALKSAAEFTKARPIERNGQTMTVIRCESQTPVGECSRCSESVELLNIRKLRERRILVLVRVQPFSVIGIRGRPDPLDVDVRGPHRVTASRCGYNASTGYSVDQL